MKLVFATNNKNKLREVQSLLKNNITLLSLSDIGCPDELPETGSTLEANARQKAEYVHKKFQVNCFADDTGLEIEALDGRPGVYSARYAGKEQDANKNIEKVLSEMHNIDLRTAVFRTVICLIINYKYHSFEGIVKGSILREKLGNSGFGYDPIFVPEGHAKTFAEMSLEEKNKISHRAIAVKRLSEFLNTLE